MVSKQKKKAADCAYISACCPGASMYADRVTYKHMGTKLIALHALWQGSVSCQERERERVKQKLVETERWRERKGNKERKGKTIETKQWFKHLLCAFWNYKEEFFRNKTASVLLLLSISHYLYLPSLPPVLSWQRKRISSPHRFYWQWY